MINRRGFFGRLLGVLLTWKTPKGIIPTPIANPLGYQGNFSSLIPPGYQKVFFEYLKERPTEYDDVFREINHV